MLSSESVVPQRTGGGGECDSSVAPNTCSCAEMTVYDSDSHVPFTAKLKKRHILLKLAIKSALWKGRAELLRRNPGCWNVENELLWVEMSDDTVFFLFVVNFGPSWSMINNIMLS